MVVRIEDCVFVVDMMGASENSELYEWMRDLSHATLLDRLPIGGLTNSRSTWKADIRKKVFQWNMEKKPPGLITVRG